VLDARPVPGSDLVVASLTPHNGQPVGAIAMIDPKAGKNNLAAITNFTPEHPTEMDQGLTVGPCDPWALSEQDVLIANNAVGGHGVIDDEPLARDPAPLVGGEPDPEFAFQPFHDAVLRLTARSFAESVEPLIGLLNAKEKEVRENAAEALSRVFDAKLGADERLLPADGKLTRVAKGALPAPEELRAAWEAFWKTAKDRYEWNDKEPPLREKGAGGREAAPGR
jgi:hypothetical protein